MRVKIAVSAWPKMGGQVLVREEIPVHFGHIGTVKNGIFQF